MRSQNYGQRAVLVFETGEPVLETLKLWLAEHKISGGSFTAIGGLRQVTLKYFNTTTRIYEEREINEQLEVLHLTGNVGLLSGQPFVHAHITLGNRDYQTYGGHFGDGIVSPLLELVLTRIGGTLTRRENAESGLTELYPETPRYV
ncbi:MAG: PPC domain-containing DNA-binding protein [Nitrososphaerota archaeon]